VRICLVTPPSPFLLDQRVFVSLGILKVGAVLERQGFSVDHVDLTGVSNYEEAIRDYPHKDAIFALTATTPQMPSAIAIRSALAGSRTILGGPHTTLINAAAKKGNQRSAEMLSELVSIFGTVVAGDGEKSIFTAIHQRGLIDADDPKSILWNTSKDFTDDPWPARHLVDMSSYHYTVDGRKSYSLIGQTGCPMHCNFCGGRNSPMLRQIRKRSTENIVAEMMHLHDVYGADGAMFYDDELNINKSIIPLMRQIANTGVDWRLRGFVKSELFTEEQAESMYAAGFRWLLCGFEAAHPRILRNIAKNATVQDNTNMLRIAHKHGLKVKALMSVGHPAESEETILAMRDWLLDEKPDDFDVTVITVYPGTPYHDSAIEVAHPIYRFDTFGDSLYFESVDFNKEQAFYKGKPGEYRSYVWTDFISRERLAQMRDEIEDEVRSKLSIPYPTAAEAVAYEHSMGMSLPTNILRTK